MDSFWMGFWDWEDWDYWGTDSNFGILDVEWVLYGQGAIIWNVGVNHGGGNVLGGSGDIALDGEAGKKILDLGGPELQRDFALVEAHVIADEIEVALLS